MLQSPKRWHPDTCAHIYRATHTDTEKPVAVGQLNLHAVWGPVQTKQRQTKDSKGTKRKSQARYDFLRALSAQTGFQSLTFDYLHKCMLHSWNRNVNIIGRYHFFNPSSIKPVYPCVVQPWNSRGHRLIGPWILQAITSLPHGTRSCSQWDCLLDI